jgi:hypothetical protein
VPIPAAEVAQLFFERALVALAAHRAPEARRDLAAALRIDPSLAPDPDVYGPPVIRALDAARREVSRERPVSLRVSASLADAVVTIDGRVVDPAAPLDVRGAGPHLVSAARIGHLARTVIATPAARGETRVDLVLDPAPPAALAAQLGAAADPNDGGLVARAIGAGSYVSAETRGAGAFVVRVVDAATLGLVREVEGGPVDWEPRPYAALAAQVAGRVLLPPSPEAVHTEVSLVVTAPTTVEPGAPVALRLALRDPDRRVVRVVARCGDVEASATVAAGRERIGLTLAAPAREGAVACRVRGIDSGGATVVQAPAPGRTVAVRVAESDDSGPWYGRWYVWASAGAVLAAGVGTAVAFTAGSSDTVIHGTVDE